MIDFKDSSWLNVGLLRRGFAYESTRQSKRCKVLLSFVGSEKGTPEEASFNRRLIDDDTIFLIVPCEARHGDDRVDSNRHFRDGDVFGGFGCDNRSLGIVFFVAWLWLENGMTDPQTPKIIDGWI